MTRLGGGGRPPRRSSSLPRTASDGPALLRDASENEVAETVLENGVRVLSERIPGVRSASVGVWVKQGSAHERPEEMGYPIEGVVQEGEGAAEAEKPIEFYLASADPAAGEQVFKKCTACHNADKGGANALGPNLWGVLGEGIGKGAHGFAFSPALSGVGGTWNWDNLSAWLTSPTRSRKRRGKAPC